MSKTQAPIEDGKIEIFGAREHNLKNIDLELPRNKLIVFTGLSGSGKSSLAFDTIFAEGQRRYLDSFSAYARQFIGEMKRPEVDKINGLSPVIAIEQKTVSRNPRSTVGTITEIYDFLRLLYARAGIAYSYLSGEVMVKFTEQQVIENIVKNYSSKKLMVLAPLVKSRKGHYRELFELTRKRGYTKVRVDGEIQDIEPGMQLDRYKIHDVEVLIDRIEVSEQNKQRLSDSVKMAFKLGQGYLMVIDEDNNIKPYSKFLMDPITGLSYEEPQPNLFSFNSPYGACEKCEGLGNIQQVEVKNIIPDPAKSINKGAILPIGELRDNWTFTQLRALSKKYNFSLADSVSSLSDEIIDIILNGTQEKFIIEQVINGKTYKQETHFKGVVNIINDNYADSTDEQMHRWAEEFMDSVKCPECEGTRLKKQSIFFKISDKNIAQLAEMSIKDLTNWFENIETQLNERQNLIAKELLKEIKSRLLFLKDIGLDYLSLNSPSKTLSGGEAQRIRLATQIGSQLQNVLYILDEPSIGLHQRDNRKLIQSLKNLRDMGNTVLVVEHDKEMIEEADFVVDIGPKAGIHGGHIVCAAPAAEFIKQSSVTADYVNGKRSIEIPAKRRISNGKTIEINGCTGNNLKNVNATFPLGIFTCITGVSGSGKSSLINETLFPAIHNHLWDSHYKTLPYTNISGLEHIDKVIKIDQTPIGRTPRSNPATYVGVFTDIRNLFAEIPESKIRGYKPGRFSFNVKGGRCEECGGGGKKIIEMNFLPSVEITCDVCQGKRYNRETLEVRFRGKSINDVLDMSIEQALEFFDKMPHIKRKIQTMHDVGLDYLTLGQSSTTISGGEAQRVKLATELSKKDTGNTLYLLDEPTTGLHFEDINVLIGVLNTLVEKGNTVLVIEHNLDVIKVADYLIDLGPEGGNGGGYIITEGTPEKVSMDKKSFTALFLKEEFENYYKVNKKPL